MIVSDLIRREQFFHSDCIAVNSFGIMGYKFTNGQFEIEPDVSIDESDLTDILQNFSVEIDGASYVGGEASAHGSCGFFYKMTGDSLSWALMSLESNPFIGVEVHGGSARFLSSSGVTWVVPSDDLKMLYIEKAA